MNTNPSRHALSLLLAATLVGCPGGGTDTGSCSSTTGTLTGTTGLAPSEVHAQRSDGSGELLTATTDSSGAFELTVDATDGPVEYAVAGVNDLGGPNECWTPDHLVQVDACGTATVDLYDFECVTVDKPNLYLYPATDTETQVHVDLAAKQAVIVSAPEYGDGWSGVAHPDGTFTVNGERFPFLFYEVSLAPGMAAEHLQRSQGWCLPGDGAVEAMAALLARYGFNEREQQDFIDGWRDDLPAAPSYAVSPQLAVAPMAGLRVEPALPVSRLWLAVSHGTDCALSEPTITPFDRSAPHGVEWGVVLLGL